MIEKKETLLIAFQGRKSLFAFFNESGYSRGSCFKKIVSLDSFFMVKLERKVVKEVFSKSFRRESIQGKH